MLYTSIKTISQSVKVRLLNLPKPIRWISLGLLIVLVIILLMRSHYVKAVQNHEAIKANARFILIENKLTQQAAQIDQLKLLINEQIPKFNHQLNEIHMTLASLREQAVKPEIMQEVNSVSNSTQQLSANFNNLQSQVNQINDKINKTAEPNYLPPSLLPFKVVGIDIWNGTTKVTVKLSGELSLMTVSDTLAKWTLINVSADSGIAIFKSDKGQFVKVTL